MEIWYRTIVIGKLNKTFFKKVQILKKGDMVSEWFIGSPEFWTLPCSKTFSSTWFLSLPSLRPFISYLKAIMLGEIYIKIKSYEFRIKWVYSNDKILNFYYYKNCNEIKFSISLCSKKVRQIFVPVCSRIATQADNAK